jgi:hypothetical protein
MAPIAPSTPITLTIPKNTILSIPTSIFEPSPVTFIDDYLSHKISDIDLSKLTNISSWCGSFTVNHVF